jgi:outer membrane protein assembly factor BamB
MRRGFAVVSVGVLATVVSYAQVGKITQQDWVTSGADAQRTSWIRNDAFISTDSMQKPGFGLRWKVTLGDRASSSSSVASGVVFGNLGFGSKPVSFITSRNNHVFAVDDDTGVVFWERDFGRDAAPGRAECPAGITGAATRPATLVPVIPVWRGLPERGPYTSGVGAPGEGVPAFLMNPPRPPASSNTNAPARASAPPAPPLPQVVYALSNDGLLHTLGLYSGKDVAKPIRFLPASAHASDLIALNGAVYAATMNDCGGVADGVWAVDLANDAHAVTSWKSDGSPVGAPAFGADGTVLVSTPNALVALDPKDLTVRNKFTRAGAPFVTSPVVFKAGERDVVAVAARDESIFLFDVASLRELSRGTFVSSSLAAWEDSTGTRWLLSSTPTTISAMKATSLNNVLMLQTGWTRPMRAPLAPIIVNGVAFVLSGSEPAVLYALDAATGRELWTSGRTITSPARRSAIWAGIGQVHVATSDNTVYAFGFAMERD